MGERSNGPTTSRGAALVIEDQPILRMEAVDLVESAGFEVLEAAGADEAVRLLETRPDIRLVFSDIDPTDGGDGLELAHAIRNRWPPVAIIVVSGKRKPEPHQLPARGLFFPKPYRREAVAAAMHRLVSPAHH